MPASRTAAKDPLWVAGLRGGGGSGRESTGAGKASVHKERFAIGGDEQRGLAAFDVDEVDVECGADAARRPRRARPEGRAGCRARRNEKYEQ